MTAHAQSLKSIFSRHPKYRDVQYRTVRPSLSFCDVLFAVVIPGQLRRYHAKMRG